ncbi:YihY/virulence factor BrkB family protein [Nocardioides zeae]|uniref:YihY/virulence factor BrkB family protein n=1 Tax=Nocardioides imazamoxiresistens TaxID=3231893 RepID=A0ABU3PW84_9ACTN|nr:YihY/virulence factor BrkB family protein [Nocardioides zeae]MDT9593499.1 YihY/virulence factor BrkB family protein [Nocardioides zeae]
MDAYQRDHPAIGLPVAVVYKYGDDGGGHLAALVTYYGFVSLFPLLLLGSTVLGIVLEGDPELQQRILDSAMSQIPVVGADLARPEQLGGGVLGILIGGAGAIYGALGVGQAVQNASNTAWNVPRHLRPNPFTGRLRSAGLAAVIGSNVIATTAAAGVVGRADFLGPATSVLAFAVTFGVHLATFAVVLRLSAASGPPWRRVLPGAVLASVAWIALQYGGVAFVGRYVASSPSTNGVFAVVLGLLAFLYLTSVAIVLSIELNVVLAENLYPRSLLTPFTDDVVLTEADEHSYEEIAKAQKLKGFQQIEVSFEPENETEPEHEPERHRDQPVP